MKKNYIAGCCLWACVGWGHDWNSITLFCMPVWLHPITFPWQEGR